MTVAATPRKAGPFAGNDVTTLFPFGFKVFTADDVQVVYTGPDGVAVTLVLNSDYSVLLNADQDATPGGTITYPLVGSPLTVGDTLTAIGDLPYAQPTDITNTGRFLPQVIENSLDRATIQIQQLAEVSSRTLQAAVGTSVSLIFPAPSAGKFIRWRTDLLGLENAEAGTDSMVLQGLLADSALGTRGAGMIGFNPALTYPGSTAGERLAGLASFTNAAKGAAYVGYLPSWAGAVGATVAEALNERVSAARFGLAEGNTGAQNNTAMAAAIAYAIAQGGLTIHVPRGTYNFATSINFAGASGSSIVGDGIDATVLQIEHATADFVVCGSSTYQTIANLTLTSSVTRTAGAMITGGYWTRGLIERVKITQHFNGIHLTTFEECYVVRCSIVTPSGQGSAIIAGTQNVANQGANLHILSCFIRGNEESSFLNPCVGQFGVVIYDVSAVYMFDTDIACILDQCLLVNPLTAASDLFFIQTYFDGTQNGDNVLLTGSGVKRRILFTGSWFSFAGRLGAGMADRMGINFANSGDYDNIMLDGCKFQAQTGAGIYVGHINADINITGAVIQDVGFNTATYKCGIYVTHSASQGKFMLINGVKFIPAAGNTADIIFATANSRENVINGCLMPKGISYPSGTTFGAVAGNMDQTTDNIASGSNLHLSPNKKFYTVTGTANIDTMDRTYPGHIMMLVFQGALTVANGSSIKLAGGANLVTVTGTTLTLMCEPVGGGWREVTRHN